MTLDPSRYPQSGDVLVDGVTVGTSAGRSAAPAELYSPEWWRRRLLLRLIDRARICSEFHDFYEGRQPLAFASSKFIETYGRRFDRFPANFMPLVIDAERERLVVDGFRFGRTPAADRGVWKIWQANQLDAESQIAHEIALTKGVAYAAVDPFADSPSITIEDPSETIVETAPGNRRLREAALKVYLDDDGYSRAYLYLPDQIYRWRSRNRRTDSTSYSLGQVSWEPYTADGGDFPIANRLGVVPIVPLINRPRRDGSGRSEIEPVMGNQLAINFLRYAALIGSDTAALPQRWAKNLDLEIDPNTGKVKEPFRAGRDTLWATRRPTPEEAAEYGDRMPDVEFGQFPEASLSPFVDMIREEVGQMASNSRTPYHYLLGTPQSIPPSGESLKSSEAPLVKKVEAQEIHFGEGWEELMRVALLAAGQPAKAARSTDAETVWRDAETRNEAARTDSILKQFAAINPATRKPLIPRDFALEELGYSQQQIERIHEIEAQDPVPQAPAPIAPPTGQPDTMPAGMAEPVPQP
jgi:Phage portal protein, SPP1 Gp6-like